MAAAILAIRRRNRRRREERESHAGDDTQNGELTIDHDPKQHVCSSNAGQHQLGASNSGQSSQPLPARASSSARKELPHQTQVRNFYEAQSVTMGVALLITINFIVSAAIPTRAQRLLTLL